MSLTQSLLPAKMLQMNGSYGSRHCRVRVLYYFKHQTRLKKNTIYPTQQSLTATEGTLSSKRTCSKYVPTRKGLSETPLRPAPEKSAWDIGTMISCELIVAMLHFLSVTGGVSYDQPSPT